MRFLYGISCQRIYDVSLHCSLMKNNMDGMYHQQQNKWYPNGCFLAHFEDNYILDIRRNVFTCT